MGLLPRLLFVFVLYCVAALCGPHGLWLVFAAFITLFIRKEARQSVYIPLLVGGGALATFVSMLATGSVGYWPDAVRMTVDAFAGLLSLGGGAIVAIGGGWIFIVVLVIVIVIARRSRRR